MKIALVVGDRITQTEILARYLQQAGLSVIVVKSGEEARQEINTPKPDLILLEVVLAGESGFEICRELKSDPNTSTIPIIFYSEQRNSELDRYFGNMLGAEAYLSHPIDRQELEVTLKQLL